MSLQEDACVSSMTGMDNEASVIENIHSKH